MGEQDQQSYPQQTPPHETDPNPPAETPAETPEPIEGDQGPQVADGTPANAQGTSFDPDRPVRTTPPAPHELAGSPEVADLPSGFATPTELGTGNSDETSDDAIVADESEPEPDGGTPGS